MNVRLIDRFWRWKKKNNEKERKIEEWEVTMDEKKKMCNERKKSKWMKKLRKIIKKEWKKSDFKELLRNGYLFFLNKIFYFMEYTLSRVWRKDQHGQCINNIRYTKEFNCPISIWNINASSENYWQCYEIDLSNERREGK